MAIRRDLSDLPPAGLAPDEQPRFISVLVDEWAESRDDDKATAMGTPFRHSDAGKCARAISYTAAGIPRSDPMDITGVWNTSLGSLIHEQWQNALQARYPDAEVEVTCATVGADGSGHIDAVIYVHEEDQDDDGRAGAPVLAEGPDGPTPDGVLGVDRGDGTGRVRGDGPRPSSPRERHGASTGVRDVRGADTGGAPGGSPLPESVVREPSASRSGDPAGEHPEGRGVLSAPRSEDGVPEGTPVQRPEPEDHEYGLSEVSGVRAPAKVICYELKSVGGFGFKAAVGAARKGTPAEGPKSAHLLQAAINGRAVDADEVIVGYLAKECISATVAKRFGIGDDVGRFAAEWTLTREQYEPLADLEAERIDGILGLVADGKLAARKSPEMPVGAEVTDPETGAYEVRLRTEDDEVTVTDTGSTWECDCCSFQTLCATTEAGRIPIESVVAIKAVA